MTDRLRIDKWLWAARFFKTRGLAQTAVKGGKVDINGERCKPARPVAPGDRLIVTKGETRFEVEVLAISTRRGPAAEAEKLYRETEASIRRREEAALRRKMEAHRHDHGKPDKRERRRARDIKRG